MGHTIHIAKRISDDEKIARPDPYTALFRDALVSARDFSASDIHIEPTRHGIDIRFRVSGEMFLWKALDIRHRQAFINEAKRISNFSIAVTGRAQDSRISFKEWNLDVRCSLLPSQYGENIVLRLLDLTRSFAFENLGFGSQTLKDIQASLGNSNGLIVISGPTGSGKTTTLYTLLCALDRKLKNIITLEDPIEYSIEGLTQVQINSKLGFSGALRAVLRQDPDVILVGEIRDEETADLCLKAAATGHLVLSTIHANGAAEVVSRLLNLGVEKYMLESVARFSGAQRLVKRLCRACAGVSEDGVSRIFLRNLNGCSECKRGITGRIAVLEYMKEEDIQGYLRSGEAKLASSLRDTVRALAERGEVDFDEAQDVR